MGTLEEMAGEIGASVIVVKEIEVPAEVSGVVGDWDGDGDRWRRRQQLMSEDSETTTTTETELETDADDDLPAASNHVEMFSMDEGDCFSESAAFSVDLEIATVYKPRPFRRRATSTVQGHLDRRKGKGRKPKHLLAHSHTRPNSHPEHHTHHSHHINLHNRTLPVVSTHLTEPQSHIAPENKRSKRRASRDKRRESKCNPLLLHVPTRRIDIEEMGELVSDLESFHVTLESEGSSASARPEVEPCMHENAHLNDDLDSRARAPVIDSFLSKPKSSVVDARSTPSISAGPYQQPEHVTNEYDSPPPEIMKPPKSLTTEIKEAMSEPRLIVEALVVRKMSLEEAFLDFGGFSVL